MSDPAQLDTTVPVVSKCPPGCKLYRGTNGPEYAVPKGLAQWQCALLVFGITPHSDLKLFHWKDFVTCVWPEPVFIWDDWCDLFFGALCGAKETIERITGQKIETDKKWWRNVIFTGAASTGKSAKSAMWVLGNWMVEQRFTTGVITSTSMDALRARIWSSIPELVGSANVKFPLEIVGSELEVRWHVNDDKGVIRGVAVKSGGNVTQAVDAIKGRHNRRVFVVIDEMTSVSDAIVVASRNLSSGTDEFQLIGLGNARDKIDPHGQRSEPVGGWQIIDPQTRFWLTQYGCAVHFNANDSPGLINPKRFHFYPTREWMAEQAQERGGANSPEYWSTVIGFWPPTGLSNKVMDEAFMDQFEVRRPAVWKGLWQVAASLDPSFEGGDLKVLYPFAWGEFSNGITGLHFFEPITLEVDVSQDKRWIHYQVADAAQKACEQFKVNGQPMPVQPENFIMDVTGEGGGLFSIMSGRWSPKIQAVEFGGAAEKVQISPDRPTTYHELYANKVTMLWYVFRRFVEGGQVRNLTHPQTIKELVSRDKEMKAGKIRVLPKSEMKKIIGKSPDHADAAVIAAEFLRRKGIVPAGSTGGALLMDASAWNDFSDKTTLADEQSDYADESAAFIG